MTSGTPYEAGDIVLVPFPFTDLSATKRRPVMVLSTEGCNRRSEDFVTCGITSNLKDRGHSVVIDSGDMAEGTLPVKSQVKADKIFTLERSLVLRRLGKVRPDVLASVRREVARVIGL